MSRADANPWFNKVTLDMVHAQPLFAGLNLRLSAKGQYARAPTPASEEFSVGGADYGRAYNSGEATGEDGVAASAELTYMPGWKIPMVNRLQPYGFYDFGKAWDRRSDSSTGLAQSLSSAGFGIRSYLINGLTFRLEYAYPLTKQPSNQTDGKNGRVFFFTGWSY
jgi:hemolysin activation/secretion protein